MLITVQKQVTETLEVKTPCYYRGLTGYHHINEAGQLITISDRMITVWEPKDGKYYNEDIERIVRNSKPCERSEFNSAYSTAIQKIQSAVDSVEINS